MRKGYKGTQTITILSNKGVDGDGYTLDLPNTGYAAGTTLTEIISCSTVTVGDDGKVPVSMKKGLPRILYPSSELKGSTLCS
jgi:alpha-amylase